MSRWEDVLPINSFALRIIKLVFIIIVFVHTNACVQLLIGKLEKGDSNWMHAAGVDDASSFTQYTHALFRAVSHMITIGYGITNPQSTGEVWMVLVSMLLGAMLYAVMLGMISSMMLSMDRSGSAYVERLQMWKVGQGGGEPVGRPTRPSSLRSPGRRPPASLPVHYRAAAAPPRAGLLAVEARAAGAARPHRGVVQPEAPRAEDD